MPLVPIDGQPPELDRLPPGCPFQPRCPLRRDACSEVDMALDSRSEPDHVTACPFDPSRRMAETIPGAVRVC